VNAEAVKKMNIIKSDLLPFVSDSISWTIGKGDLYKSDLIMLDIIATNDWQRPIYFSSTLGGSSYLNLKEYMQLEGYAYRLLPVKVPGATDGYVNADVMYNNLMTKMFWRDLDNPKTYYDNTYLGSPVATARIAFLRLAGQLIADGRKDEAKKAIDKSLATMPDKSIPYDQFSANFIGPLFDLGETKRALEIAETMATRSDEVLTWAKDNGTTKRRDSNVYLYIMQIIVQECREAKQEAVAKKYEALFQKHLAAFNMYGSGGAQ
jgi:hypothetical protein